MSRYILNERQFKTKLRACIIEAVKCQYEWVLTDKFFPAHISTCMSFPEIFGLRDHYINFLKENNILKRPECDMISYKYFTQYNKKLNEHEIKSCSIFRLMVLNEFAVQNNIKLPKNL